MDRQQLLAQRKNLMARADLIVSGAKSADRDLTAAESSEVNSLLGQVDELDRQLDAKSAPWWAHLAKGEIIVGGEMKGEPWARQVADIFEKTAAAQGSKALLPVGDIGIPAPTEVVALPTRATRLLDLIERDTMDAPGFAYLRQVTFENNAAVVPVGELKPVSTATFEQVTGQAVTVAHVSEPIPRQYLVDYESVVQVLATQMEAGILSKVEDLVLNGDTGAGITGITTTTGVRAQAFTTDVPTTLRNARLLLETNDIVPNAWVLNPADLAALDMLREGTGATAGGFLLADQGVYERIFGTGVQVVPSTRVTAGTALVGDWSTVRLGVREALASALFEQHADWAQRNQVLLRTEMRAVPKIMRPGALAIADLTA